MKFWKKSQKLSSGLLSVVMMTSTLGVTQLRVLGNEDVVAKDLLISEYLEGSSNNKAIELYNGTGKEIDLSQYTVELYVNGKTTLQSTETLQGILPHDTTYVIANTQANEEIKSKAQVTSPVVNFNGDDTLLLKKNGEVIDSFGRLGEDPGSSWSQNDVNTMDMTLIRKETIISGDPIPDDEFDPSVEWTAKVKDDMSDLGKHTMVINQGPDVEAPAIVHNSIGSHNIEEDYSITAEITDNRQVTSADVFYRVKGETAFKQVALTKGEGVTYQAVINKGELSASGLEYYIEVSDGIHTITAPVDKNAPYEVTISTDDVTPPTLTHKYPAPNSQTGEVKKPEIGADYTDNQAIDGASVKLFVDGVEVTSEATTTDTSVRYIPSVELAEGDHRVKVTLQDTAGNETTEEWSFYVGTKTKNLYYGQLHAHTNLSDGAGTVEEAFEYANETAGLDFFAVTDHSNSFDNDIKANIADGSASSEWQQGRAAADKYNKPGEYVSMYGYEMTWSKGTGGYGHMNTFNTPGFESRTNSKMDLVTYYNTLKTQPQSISQFNHPGTTFGDFEGFGNYDVAVDQVVNLIEVGNGEGKVHESGYFTSYEYYTKALDKGWHVAPTNNQDNHKKKWGTANDARTVIEASELTRESVYEALSNRRVYSTEDKNLEISYELNGSTLGSILSNPTELAFNIMVNDPDLSDRIQMIELVADGGQVVEQTVVGAQSKNWEFTLPVNDAHTYYYVRVTQADKDIAVTAPIWVSEKENVGISSVTSSTQAMVVGDRAEITTALFNNEQVPVENAKVTYSMGGQVIAENAVGTIAPATTSKDTLVWEPTAAGKYTIEINATMTVNGVERSFSSQVMIQVFNPEDITKVVIDGSKSNGYVTGNYAGNVKILTQMIEEQGGIVNVNKGLLTDEVLKDVPLLVITDPASKDNDKYGEKASIYSQEEIQVIKRFVERGGNLVLTSKADYGDATGDYGNAAQANAILDAIGANVSFNDDQLADNTNNAGQAYRLKFTHYNAQSPYMTGVDTTKEFSFYSGNGVLVKEGADNVDVVVKGHATTESTDADKQGDNTPVPMGESIGLAVETLANGSKVVVCGVSFFSDFEMGSNVDYTNQGIMNNMIKEFAAPKEVTVTPINQVRVDENGDNLPDKMGETFTVEGIVTAANENPNNTFFDVIYIQDETGGLTVHPIATSKVKIGQKVRITGSVSTYEGDAQISVSNEVKDVKIIDANQNPVGPTILSTADSMLEANEGLLVKVQGEVTRIEGESIYVNDGSGEARVYINGYIGGSTTEAIDGWKERIHVGDTVSAIGLASEDPQGHRLRVRDTEEVKAVVPGEETAKATLAGKEIVKPSESFEIVLGVTDIPKQVYATDMTITYDKELFTFNKAVANEKVELAGVKDKEGVVRILTGIDGGALNQIELLALHFTAKEPAQTTTGVLGVTNTKLGSVVEEQTGTIGVEDTEKQVTIQVKKDEVTEDVNQDEKVDVEDLALVAFYYHANKDDPNSNWEAAKKVDVNSDGVIDILDLVAIASRILAEQE